MSISEYLASPAWWFSTVVVGVMCSVIASFLRDPLGQFFGQYSHRLRSWVDKRRTLEQERVDALSRDDTSLLLLKGQISDFSTWLVFSTVMSALLPVTHLTIRAELVRLCVSASSLRLYSASVLVFVLCFAVMGALTSYGLITWLGRYQKACRLRHTRMEVVKAGRES